MYSTESYRALLAMALREGYEFRSFVEKLDQSRGCIYLRHDVDFSLDVARELARINTSLGVRGSFFVLLRSQVYNVLSNWSLRVVQDIQSLGQHVAFHYSVPSALPKRDAELAARIVEEHTFLRRYVPGLQPVFSLHNPLSETLARFATLDVPGMVNVNSDVFTKDVRYYSDSNMRFSVADFEGFLKLHTGQPLHLLLHPLNWIVGGRTMLEVLARTWTYIIREREEEMLLNRHYAETLPEGMPDRVLEGFSDHWLRAASRRPK
jgi:hypothetical protein